MNKIKILTFLLLVVLVSYSCKKKKHTEPILTNYELRLLLNLYPEDGGITGGGSTTGEEVVPVVELSISGDTTIYTEETIDVTKPIIVTGGASVTLKIKGKNTTDTIYVGGYVLDDIQNYSPVSNKEFIHSFYMSGNKSFIIGVSKDADNELVDYKTFAIMNKGRGVSDMLVYTNWDSASDKITANAMSKYRIGKSAISTITLPKDFNYTLGLRAIPDNSYALEYWYPIVYGDGNKDGIMDENGVVEPYGGVTAINDLEAYLDATKLDQTVSYHIDNIINVEAVFTSFPVWDGKLKEEPTRNGRSSYAISLPSHMAWVADQVDKGNTFQGYTLYLVDNIDFNGKNFGGIANGNKIFMGTFNGNDKYITNVNFVFDVSSKFHNNGFIGYLGIDGAVSNLIISKGVTMESIGGDSFGAIVGINYGLVYYCTNYASIDADGKGSKIGGVVGYNTKRGKLLGLHNAGMVSNARSDVGGIVGLNEGSLSNSYNEGLVVGHSNVGGIVGINQDNISKVYNMGIVSNIYYGSGNAETGINVGGLVGAIGQLKGQISHSYNTGEVFGGDYSGGLVGYSYTKSITIDTCYNIGIVNGTVNKTGGLVGGFQDGVGIIHNGLLNMYFLKDAATSINTALDNTGIGEKNGYSDHVTRNITMFVDDNTMGFDQSVWVFKNALPTINGITSRFLITGVGEGE